MPDTDQTKIDQKQKAKAAPPPAVEEIDDDALLASDVAVRLSPYLIRRPSRDGSGLYAATEISGSISIKRSVPSQPKFMLEIARSADKAENNRPIQIQNGDYIAVIQRGRRVIVPLAVISILRDATSTVDGREVPTYPFSAQPYDGRLPVGTEVDMMGNPTKPEAA